MKANEPPTGCDSMKMIVNVHLKCYFVTDLLVIQGYIYVLVLLRTVYYAYIARFMNIANTLYSLIATIVDHKFSKVINELSYKSFTLKILSQMIY